MIKITIPGRGNLNLEVLVLDFNGTIAVDGVLIESVRDSLAVLAVLLDIHILTSDTFGTVVQQCSDLPVTVKILQSDEHTEEKARYIAGLAPRQVVAVGNGANDRGMLEEAELGILVIGQEGSCARTAAHADILVNRIEDALSLLHKPQRLAATLRR